MATAPGRPERELYRHFGGAIRQEESLTVGLVVVLLLLALLFGGVGLFIEGLKWALIIALVLFVASLFTGYGSRRTTI